MPICPNKTPHLFRYYPLQILSKQDAFLEVLEAMVETIFSSILNFMVSQFNRGANLTVEFYFQSFLTKLGTRSYGWKSSISKENWSIPWKMHSSRNYKFEIVNSQNTIFISVKILKD